MIQIIGYREFQGKVSHKRFVDINADSIPDLFANLEHFLKKIPPQERYNLHYTLADCYENVRDFKSQSTIAFDLDKIDPSLDKQSEYIKIMVAELGIPFDQMGIVFSGHGLHFLVETNYQIQSKEELKTLQPSYRKLCSRIEERIKAAGLPGNVDSGILKVSQTLRLPGTENRKKDLPPVMSYVINGTIVTQDFNVLGLTHVEDSGSGSHSTPDHIKDWPTPDTEAVISECEFLRWNFERPFEVIEEQWFAALSIVGRLENGRNLAHKMSEGHPGYSFGEAEAKITHAIQSAGPRTCANISEMSPKCQECKHFGKINSPIWIKGPTYMATQDQGFWIRDKKMKPVRPAYEDLRRLFEKCHPYTSVKDGGGRVYTWLETHWEEISKDAIEAFAEEHLNPSPSNSQVAEFVGKIRRSRKREKGFFDNETIGRSNLANGIFDFRTVKLIDHYQDYGFRSCMSYQYDVSAQCPTWERFLRDVTCNRQELADILEEYMAFAISGMPYIHHKILMLSGEGSNGKSTLLSILKKLGGQGSYTTTPIGQLGDPGNLAKMDGKLFNISSETPRGAFRDTSILKQLSSGEGYPAKVIYKEPYEVESNRTKLIMACNELPEISDFSEGFERRLLIIPFDAKISDKITGVGIIPADPHMDDKLALELPGIFNRIVRAYERLNKQNGFTRSELSEIATKEYKASNNMVATFFEEELEFDSTSDWYIERMPLFTLYSRWCQEVGIRNSLNPTRFGKEMVRLTGEKPIQKRINGKPTWVRRFIRPKNIQQEDFA